MTDVIEGFADLFQGNLYAFGTEEGGCERIQANSSDPSSYHKGRLAAHLSGDLPPIGVYPMVQGHEWDRTDRPVWHVKWGCIDFDEGDQESWVHAKNVHLALETFGITGWIERSRSKGYHVWVFLDRWAEAWVVRQALLAACQIVEAPTKEINPKQTQLEPGQLGNYVRLPYPGQLGVEQPMTDRRTIVTPLNRWLMNLRQFVHHALEKRTDVAALEKLAGYYKPPVKPLRTRDWSIEYDGEAIDRLLGKARIIWENGPLEGSDRSDTLYKLAMYLREDGRHTRDEAFDLMVDADARWGKFADRPDRDQRLNDMLDKAGF